MPREPLSGNPIYGIEALIHDRLAHRSRGRVVYPAVAAAVGETPLPLAELR